MPTEILVLLIVAGLVVAAVAVRSLSAPHPYGEAVPRALLTARRVRWAVRPGAFPRADRIVPADPTAHRTIHEHLHSAVGAGAAVLATEAPRDGSPERLTFYIWTPVRDVGDSAVFCAALGSTAIDSTGLSSAGRDLVHALRDQFPEANMVWVARGNLGVGVPADMVTNPEDWVRCLEETVRDRQPSLEPSRSDRPNPGPADDI